VEAVNATLAVLLDDDVAETPVGALGAVVTELDADDAEDVPLAFVAVTVTVNVYAVPPVKPLTVIGDDEPVAVNPPGELVTV